MEALDEEQFSSHMNEFHQYLCGIEQTNRHQSNDFNEAGSLSTIQEFSAEGRDCFEVPEPVAHGNNQRDTIVDEVSDEGEYEVPGFCSEVSELSAGAANFANRVFYPVTIITSRNETELNTIEEVVSPDEADMSSSLVAAVTPVENNKESGETEQRESAFKCPVVNVSSFNELTTEDSEDDYLEPNVYDTAMPLELYNEANQDDIDTGVAEIQRSLVQFDDEGDCVMKDDSPVDDGANDRPLVISGDSLEGVAKDDDDAPHGMIDNNEMMTSSSKHIDDDIIHSAKDIDDDIIHSGKHTDDDISDENSYLKSDHEEAHTLGEECCHQTETETETTEEQPGHILHADQPSEDIEPRKSTNVAENETSHCGEVTQQNASSVEGAGTKPNAEPEHVTPILSPNDILYTGDGLNGTHNLEKQQPDKSPSRYSREGSDIDENRIKNTDNLPQQQQQLVDAPSSTHISELPVKGKTKSLLEQWRQLEKENSSGGFSCSSETSPALELRSSRSRNLHREQNIKYRSRSNDEILRCIQNEPKCDSADTTEPGEVGSHHYRSRTKNLRAKFEKMEATTNYNDTRASPIKTYKWKVKEPELLQRAGFSRRSKSETRRLLTDTDDFSIRPNYLDTDQSRTVNGHNNHNAADELPEGSYTDF